MAFQYSEKNREEYYSADITLLRGLIPATLLSDLRREAKKAREIARTVSGSQAQRLQPLRNYPELDQEVFQNFSSLTELLTTAQGILGMEHSLNENIGMLFEPADYAWTTGWHRDWGYNHPHIDLNAFFDAALHQPQMFNQFNAALYDDHSFWVVTGSSARLDTEMEKAMLAEQSPLLGPQFPEDVSAEEKEIACQSHTRQMPGATNIVLCAGDVAFYRAVAWHTGNYVPYVQRATIHTCFDGPDDRAWRANVPMAKPTDLEKAGGPR